MIIKTFGRQVHLEVAWVKAVGLVQVTNNGSLTIVIKIDERPSVCLPATAVYTITDYPVVGDDETIQFVDHQSKSDPTAACAHCGTVVFSDLTKCPRCKQTLPPVVGPTAVTRKRRSRK